MTRAEFSSITATLTTTIKTLSDQMAAMTTKDDDINNNCNNNNNNNRNNLNRRGEPIPVIRVRNNNLTIVMYRKSEHTRESNLEYYEHKYYNKLKDDYYKFKIFDSIYRCPFCYNKDYSLTDLLTHASIIAGNSRKTVKDIVKHFVLIMYILKYHNVNVDKNKPFDVNIASDKQSGVSIASGRSVNLSLANQKSLGMNVTKW